MVSDNVLFILRITNLSLNGQIWPPYDEQPFFNSFWFLVHLQRLRMGHTEFFGCFNTYKIVRSEESYGPGHRGMSAFIFKASALGFMDANFLCEQLEDRLKDEDRWSCPNRRVLYGYMAEERDMEIFNEHAQGTISPSLVIKVHLFSFPLLFAASRLCLFLVV